MAIITGSCLILWHLQFDWVNLCSHSAQNIKYLYLFCFSGWLQCTSYCLKPRIGHWWILNFIIQITLKASLISIFINTDPLGLVECFAQFINQMAKWIRSQGSFYQLFSKAWYRIKETEFIFEISLLLQSNVTVNLVWTTDSS